MPHVVARYRYTADTAARDAARAAHREYLGTLPQLLASGPTDDGGAVLVFEADSTEEVERLLDADPFVTDGVVAEREATGWEIVRGRWAPPD